MEEFNSRNHWEQVYSTKQLKDVSWYQPVPETSLDFVKRFGLPKDARIIDVGGGDSLLVDHLLTLGYQNVTVLDISASSLDRAKRRLGEKANEVKWIVADVTKFVPDQPYDFWHDRAAFHFLTNEADINAYVNLLKKGINPDGILVLGTFSENGPKKCSGLEIRQYTEVSMTKRFRILFDKIRCITIDHTTPFEKVQNFIFCSFRRRVTLVIE